jgi:hypothetical protein
MLQVVVLRAWVDASVRWRLFIPRTSAESCCRQHLQALHITVAVNTHGFSAAALQPVTAVCYVHGFRCIVVGVMRGLLVGLTLLLVPGWVAAGESKGYKVPCPFQYPRHTLDDVAAGRATPYLFGGIYKRPCVNCRRGGLWSTWCGWSNTTLPFYDQQLCTKAVTDAVIQEAAARRWDEGALTMTPCDLWYYMRGRTTWIIG